MSSELRASIGVTVGDAQFLDHGVRADTHEAAFSPQFFDERRPGDIENSIGGLKELDDMRSERAVPRAVGIVCPIGPFVGKAESFKHRVYIGECVSGICGECGCAWIVGPGRGRLDVEDLMAQPGETNKKLAVHPRHVRKADFRTFRGLQFVAA